MAMSEASRLSGWQSSNKPAKRVNRIRGGLGLAHYQGIDGMLRKHFFRDSAYFLHPRNLHSHIPGRCMRQFVMD